MARAHALLAATLMVGIIALASAARVEPGRRLQATGDASHDHDHDHDHDHGVDMKPLELNLTEVHGVWFGLADQIPVSISKSYGVEGFPNCSLSKGFDYTHYSPSDPHYQSIATMGDMTTITGSGHLRGSSKRVVAYEDGVLQVQDAEGVSDCMRFETYVDLRSGQVKATSLRSRVYKEAANGTVLYESTNCQLTGDEEPGCMEDGSKEDGTFTVTAVMRSTWVCQAGSCLSFSPLYNPEDDSHAH